MRTQYQDSSLIEVREMDSLDFSDPRLSEVPESSWLPKRNILEIDDGLDSLDSTFTQMDDLTVPHEDVTTHEVYASITDR